MQDHEKMHPEAGGNGLKKYGSRLLSQQQRTANANNDNTAPAAVAEITTINRSRPTTRDANANRIAFAGKYALPSASTRQQLLDGTSTTGSNSLNNAVLQNFISSGLALPRMGLREILPKKPNWQQICTTPSGGIFFAGGGLYIR
jgi:hypothetical protein